MIGFVILVGWEGNFLYYIDTNIDGGDVNHDLVSFRVGNSVCDKPIITTHMDVCRIKLMRDVGFLSNFITKVSTNTFYW